MIIWVVKIFFVQFFYVFLQPLLNHFCSCKVLAIFVLYCSRLYLFLKCSLDIFSFLEEISSLPYSIVFLYFFILLRKLFFFFLISPCYFWDSAFKWVYHSLSPLPFTSLLSQLFVKPPQTIILPFCISFSWGFFGYCLLYSVMTLHP